MRRAFTLVELLVVIAVLAVLAAILFPVFASAKESAKGTSCVSNLKQFSYATAMYVTDSDGTFPQSVYSMDAAILLPGSGQRAFTYYDAVFPYVRNTEIMDCPSQRPGIDFQRILNGVGLRPAGQFKFSSYAINFGLFEDPALPPELFADDPVISESQLVEPVATISLYDGFYVGHSSLGGGSALPGCPTPYGPFGWDNFSGHPRHRDGINAAFADGHVKRLSRQATLPSFSGPERTYNLPCDLSGLPQGKPNS